MLKAWVLRTGPGSNRQVETIDLSWREGKRERNSGTNFSCPFEDCYERGNKLLLFTSTGEMVRSNWFDSW